MKAFGIFEGGGAKGIAHIGALRSAEERNVEFIGVAGASAGAVVAAFVAAGYNSLDLFNPDNDRSDALFHENLVEFLDPKLWKKIKPIKDRLGDLGVKIISSKGRILKQLFDPRNFSINWSVILLVLRIVSKQGIFDADHLEEWIEKKLRHKLFPEQLVLPKAKTTPRTANTNKGLSISPNWAEAKPDPITFRDLPIPLSIVTTNLTSRSIYVFSKGETPNFSVAKAVVASLSLPFVFTPISSEGRQFIDGGVLSNFPAWVFDQQRKALLNPTPTFGFRLHNSRPVGVETKDASKGIVAFFDNLFATIFSGDNILEVREIEDLNLIPIDVRASTLDFDMDYTDKRNLYLEGHTAANRFFNNYIGPKDPEQIEQILEFLGLSIRQILKDNGLHLRANVWLPTTNNERLRILYSHNMSDDADDRLTLTCEQGCVGRCWSEHRIVWANLKDARTNFGEQWQMNKYQQALVRSALNSLISVPIFNKQTFNSKIPWIENSMIGVLSIDSDNYLIDQFARAADDESDGLHKALVGASKVLAREICG